jgi:hypothetical protein
MGIERARPGLVQPAHQHNLQEIRAMPTLPSGRTLGLASTIDYAQLVWREQTHIVNRADLELVRLPEDLYPGIAVVERTDDGRDEPLGLSIREFLDGKGGFSTEDRTAYAEWLQLPHVVARLQQDLDALRAALAQTRFRLPANVRELFPEEHAAEALLDLAMHGMEAGDPDATGKPAAGE